MTNTYPKQTKVWITKDGRRIRICDMSDDHLLNTIRLLQRSSEMQRIQTTVFYVTCQGPSGDAAQCAFEQEFDRVLDSTWEDYAPSIYKNLEQEALRRDLEIPIQSTRVDIEVRIISERVAISSKTEQLS